MTSERPRFPVGLTLAAVIVFAICFGLGVWQLRRAAWKVGELKRIVALKGAAPQPIEPVLARASSGWDASFTRVAADCAPGSIPTGYHLTTDNDEWVARARADCHLSDGPYNGILVDRGLVASSRGATVAPTAILPAPQHVEGVLYHLVEPTSAPAAGMAAPYILVVERETPAPPGVTPAPYPDAAGNLEYVGSYAPTWFGLAGVAACFYAAMLWRRHHPRR